MAGTLLLPGGRWTRSWIVQAAEPSPPGGPIPPLALPKRAAALIAKDTVPYVAFLGALPSGDLLVIEAPGYAEPPGRLLRRDGQTFAVEAELPGVNGPGVLSPSGRTLLAGGPLVEGEYASCVLVDLEAWQVVRALPLVCPFTWIDERRFAAQR